MSHHGPDQSTNDILRSISITIRDVQMKLSSIEEKSRKHDEAFKHIEESLHHLQKSQSDHEQARMAKFKCKSHKSPRGLNVLSYHIQVLYLYIGLCEEKFMLHLNDDDQYRADEKVASKINFGGSVMYNLIMHAG